MHSMLHMLLFKNDLQGQIPSTIGLLTTVRDLILYENQLTGTIPTTLGLLTELIFLDLYGNPTLDRK